MEWTFEFRWPKGSSQRPEDVDSFFAARVYANRKLYELQCDRVTFWSKDGEVQHVVERDR
jgi:hypothetical protein